MLLLALAQCAHSVAALYIHSQNGCRVFDQRFFSGDQDNSAAQAVGQCPASTLAFSFGPAALHGSLAATDVASNRTAEERRRQRLERSAALAALASGAVEVDAADAAEGRRLAAAMGRALSLTPRQPLQEGSQQEQEQEPGGDSLDDEISPRIAPFAARTLDPVPDLIESMHRNVLASVAAAAADAKCPLAGLLCADCAHKSKLPPEFARPFASRALVTYGVPLCGRSEDVFFDTAPL